MLQLGLTTSGMQTLWPNRSGQQNPARVEHSPETRLCRVRPWEANLCFVPVLVFDSLRQKKKKEAIGAWVQGPAPGGNIQAWPPRLGRASVLLDPCYRQRRLHPKTKSLAGHGFHNDPRCYTFPRRYCCCCCCCSDGPGDDGYYCY